MPAQAIIQFSWNKWLHTEKTSKEKNPTPCLNRSCCAYSSTGKNSCPLKSAGFGPGSCFGYTSVDITEEELYEVKIQNE